jgi:hypothetical protein
MKLALLFSLLLFPLMGEARVFDFNRETFAAYFMGTAGTSAMGTSAVKGESGSTIAFSDESKTIYSGEFGFLYSLPQVSFRFGFEYLSPASIKDASANNGTSDLYTVNSVTQAYIPKLTVEINVRGAGDARSFVGITAGSANFTLKNDYTLTAAGSALWPGMDTSAEGKGTGTLMALSLGHEGLLSDTTTYAFEFGYRYLKIDNMEYSSNANVFGTSHSSGDAMKTQAGSARDIDLSGIYLGLSFRFYL